MSLDMRARQFAKVFARSLAAANASVAIKFAFTFN
jgi:hypothetical protein